MQVNRCFTLIVLILLNQESYVFAENANYTAEARNGTVKVHWKIGSDDKPSIACKISQSQRQGSTELFLKWKIDYGQGLEDFNGTEKIIVDTNNATLIKMTFIVNELNYSISNADYWCISFNSKNHPISYTFFNVFADEDRQYYVIYTAAGLLALFVIVVMLIFSTLGKVRNNGRYGQV